MKKKLIVPVAVSLLFFQTALYAEDTSDNPTGISGVYNGNVTDGCSWDPLTGNEMRVVDDIVVPGTIGAYPLKWTRYWNSRHKDQMDNYNWTFSYKDYVYGAGAIDYPDGRSIPSEPTCTGGIEEMNNGTTFPDGGGVGFAEFPEPGPSRMLPAAIYDPYGVRTSMEYSSQAYSDGKILYRLSKVVNAGRYLQIFYATNTLPPENTDNWDLITPYYTIVRVEAHDSQGNLTQWVNYTWNGQIQGAPNPDSPHVYTELLRVDYTDGTHAQYTYEGDGGKKLMTAQDVRYNGAMRQIEYEYVPGDGLDTHHILKEKNLITHEMVTFRDVSDSGLIERRGDNAQRTFQYAKAGKRDQNQECINSPANGGKLVSYTDFLNHTTTIEYEGDYNDVEAVHFGFIRKVTDPNGHTTTFDRQAGSWGIKTITHPDGSTIQQTFWPVPGFDNEHAPWFLASRTDENHNTTSYNRDLSHRITDKYYPDGSYEHFVYDDHTGLILTHRMRNGAYQHFSYDPNTLLLSAKTVPTWNSSHGSATDAADDPTRPSPPPGPPPPPPDAQTVYTYYTSADVGGAWTDRLKTETDPRGITTQYEYDRSPAGDPVAGRGLVTRITHVDDGTYQSFGYNNYGDKMWEENELRQRTSYEYDDYGRVTKVTDPLGHFTTHDYRRSGTFSAMATTSKEPFSTTLPTGETTHTLYDDNWRKTAVIQLDGSNNPPTTHYFYDAGTRPADGSTNVGLLTSVTDPKQNPTSYAYDIRDRKTTTTNALGQTATTGYDDVGNVTSIIRTDLSVETKVFDSMNRVLTDTVPKAGPPQSPTEYVTTTFEYYPGGATQMAGQLKKIIDGRNRATTFEYDPAGMKTTMMYPLDASQDSDPAQYQAWFYDADHNLISRTTVGGVAQLFNYDLRNRQISMAWSNAADWATFGYDAVGRMTLAQNPTSTVARIYDDAGRMTHDKQQFQILPVTAVSRKNHLNTGTFDITLPLTGMPGIEGRQGQGPNLDQHQIVVTFPRPITFDHVGITSGSATVGSTATNSDGKQVTVNLTNVADAQTIVATVFGVTDGTVTNDVNIGMELLYGDVNGDGFVNAGDSILVRNYSGNVAAPSTFMMDLNLDGLINAGDRVIARNQAGHWGNAFAITQSTQSSPIYDVQYAYDYSNRIRQVSVPNTDPSYDFTFTYDTIGRFEKIFNTGGAQLFQYGYDAVSNVIDRKNLAASDSGKRITQHYGIDALNRIQERDLIRGTSTFAYEVYGYDPARPGLMTSVTRNDGRQDQFSYDLLPELTSAQYGLWQYNGFADTDMNGDDVDPVAYGDHANGNDPMGPIGFGNPDTGGLPSAAADLLIDQPVDPDSAQTDWSTQNRVCSYTWDKAGNRMTMADTAGPSRTYGTNNLNQYWSDGTNPITSGPQHELQTYLGVNYAYINDTHLSSILGNGNSYYLNYDALGRCVVRNFNGVINYYVYDGEKPIVEYGNAYGQGALNLYGRGIDEVLMRKEYLTRNNVTSLYTVYYQDDHEGNITHLTDESGNVIEWYRYDAFGAPTFFNADSPAQLIGGSNWNNRFLFTGREYDLSFSVYEYRNRAYHPGLGRFMSEDPKGFGAGDNNFFRYVGNDPLDRTDPMGLDSVIVTYPDYWVSIGHGLSMPWGHVGLLTINNHTGATRYYEYGRYPGADGHTDLRGHVVISSPGNALVKDGHVDRNSLTPLLQTLSASSGQHGRVEAAYIATNDHQQMKINRYADARYAEGNDPNRRPYSVLSHSCNDFPREAVSASGIKVPAKISPYPNQEIGNLQRKFDRVTAPAPPNGSTQPLTPTPHAASVEPPNIGGEGFVGLGVFFGGRESSGAGGAP